MSGTDNRVLLEDEFLDAARTLRRNKALRDSLDEEDRRAKEILAKVLTAGDVGTDPETDAELVKVQAGARVWNESAARANLPAEQLKSITVTVTEERLDKDKAKQILAPVLYDMCTKQNADSVRVV